MKRRLRLARAARAGMVAAAAVVALAAAPAMGAKITLRLHHFNPLNRASTKVFEAACKEFAKDNPGITVKLEMTDYGPPYDNKIVTMAAANSAPDIIMGNSVSFPRHIRLLTDLTPYMKANNMKLESFVPATRDAFMDGNKLLMLPYTAGALGIYYNVNLLRERGLSTPKPNWTMDEFREYLAKATVITNNKVTTQGYSNYGILGQDTWILWTYGGDFVSKDNVYMLDKPESVKALRDWADMHAKRLASQFDVGPWYSGKGLFHSQGPWMITQFGVKWPFEVAHCPIGPSGRQSTTVFTNGWGILQSSKHKKEAFKLIKYLVSKDVLVRMTKASGEPPTTLEAVKDPRTRVRDDIKTYDVFLDALDYGRSVKIDRKTDRILAVANPFIDGFLQGKKDISGLAGISKTIQAILREK